MHSFGISERFAVLAECPLVVNPPSIPLSGRPFIASALSAGLTRDAFVPEFVLDGYAATDPQRRERLPLESLIVRFD